MKKTTILTCLAICLSCTPPNTNSRIDDLEYKIRQLEQEISSLNNRIVELEDKVSDLELKFEIVELDVSSLEIDRDYAETKVRMIEDQLDLHIMHHDIR